MAVVAVSEHAEILPNVSSRVKVLESDVRPCGGGGLKLRRHLPVALPTRRRMAFSTQPPAPPAYL